MAKLGRAKSLTLQGEIYKHWLNLTLSQSCLSVFQHPKNTVTDAGTYVHTVYPFRLLSVRPWVWDMDRTTDGKIF